MNKDLQKKIAQAGMVPANAVAQMEQWKTTEEGMSKEVGEADLDKVRALSDELELKGLPSVKEALLDIKKIMNQAVLVDLVNADTVLTDVTAGIDRLDRYIFEIPTVDQTAFNALSFLLRPMTVILNREDNRERMIVGVSLIYSTDAEKRNVPTHWFCETEMRRA